MRFELHSGSSGTYVWSSHLARFAALTPIEKKAVPKFLASIFAGVAAWESPAEFRAFVTMVHEVAHYFQDLTTGMGTWDFLNLRRNVRERLYYLRTAQGYQDAGKTKAMNGMISLDREKEQELTRKCVFVPIRRYPDERREKLQKGISICAGEKVPESDVPPFLVENMLESEAAMVTFSTVRDLKMTDEQWEIAKDNKPLWDLGSMPEVYTDTVSLLVAIFERWMGATMKEMREQYGPAAWTMFDKIMAFLLDLSWTYPDPDYFENSGVSYDEFDPGLKLMRLLARMQRATRDEAAVFQKAIWMDKDFDKAEATLTANCGFAYPPARKIYASWSSYLEKLCQSDDDRLLKARKHICDLRQEHASEMAGKHLGYLANVHIDLHCISNGIQSYWTSTSLLEQDDSIVIADVLKFNRDLAMVDYLAGSASFICPMAESRICSAAKDSCRTGITMPQQFPGSLECLVRDNYEKSKFNLRGFHE